MDNPLTEDSNPSVGTEGADGASKPSFDERRAERVAKRKAAEAEMSWDDVKASRRARAAERQDRLAALPDDVRAEKEAELAKAKQSRLANRTQS